MKVIFGKSYTAPELKTLKGYAVDKNSSKNISKVWSGEDMEAVYYHEPLKSKIDIIFHFTYEGEKEVYIEKTLEGKYEEDYVYTPPKILSEDLPFILDKNKSKPNYSGKFLEKDAKIDVYFLPTSSKTTNFDELGMVEVEKRADGVVNGIVINTSDFSTITIHREEADSPHFMLRVFDQETKKLFEGLFVPNKSISISDGNGGKYLLQITSNGRINYEHMGSHLEVLYDKLSLDNKGEVLIYELSASFSKGKKVIQNYDNQGKFVVFQLFGKKSFSNRKTRKKQSVFGYFFKRENTESS